jgi:hypothetical protein
LAPRYGGTRRPDARWRQRSTGEGHNVKAGTQELKARCAHGTWHGGTLRGGPRFSEQRMQHDDLFPRAPCAVAWGGYGAGSPHGQCGASSVHAEMTTLRRTEARRLALRHGQGKLTVQEKGRLRCSQRGRGVVVAGLTKMVARRGRTRRRQAPCSASASPPDATSFSSRGGRSGSSRPRAVPSSGASAATRRLASPSPTPLLPLPLFSFPRGGALRKGENPQVSLGLREGLDLWVIGARSKRRRGKDTVRAPVGWCGGGSEVAARQWMAPSL